MHGVDLILVVVAQGLEDPVETVVLPLDQHLQTRQCGALGLQPDPARGRGGPLLGMTLQPPLDLGLALGEDAAALGHTRHAHLEVLAAFPQLGATALECLPRLERLLQLGQRPGQLGLLRRDVGKALLRCGERGPCLLELPAHPTPFVGGSVTVGAGGLAGRAVPVPCPLRRRAGVPAAAEHDPALGQVGPCQLGGRGGILGPATGLFDRGGRDDARGRPDVPPAGGEPVTLGRDHDQVVPGQGEVDRLLPPVDPDRAPDERVEDRLGGRPALAHADVAADRLGATPGGELAHARCDRGPRASGWRP